MLAQIWEISYNFSVNMEQGQLIQDVEILERSFSVSPEAVIKPAFIIVSGLPGTGKSFFCRKLAEKLSFLIIESDAMRKVLFPTPSYSAEESGRLFVALHSLIERLLRKGIPVIFDATNLVEQHREHLYRIGDRIRAKLIVVRVEAPSELVYQRLQKRKNGGDMESTSDADWKVYERMKPIAGRIQRNHFVVDTSRDITPVIDKIIRIVKH
jgi:predicted kinase